MIRITDTEKEKFFRGVSAWLYQKAGNGLIARAAQNGVKGFENIELDGSEFRGMSFLEICRALLELDGVGGLVQMSKTQIIGKAMNHIPRSGTAATRSGYAPASDFSVLFENVMHKSMCAAYALQADTWRRFVGICEVEDFRDHNMFRSGSLGPLPVVAENAEYKNLAIPDGEKVAVSVQKYGATIAVTKHALLNDDMGALSGTAASFGATAGRTIEGAVYALLQLNSGLGPTFGAVPFFDAANNNIGTAAALSVAALDADRVKMRAQRDISSNDYLDLNPSILLVPPALESAAKIINTSAFDHDGTKLQQPNAVRGMFTDIISSPRLTSSTRRWLFSGLRAPAFVVAFLSGEGQGPVIETQSDFRTDGLSMKCRITFKVNPFDPKTAVVNAGT